MKITQGFVLFALLTGAAQAKEIEFGCENQPAKTWKKYFQFSGTYDTEKKEIVKGEYGVYEGSVADSESEPVETFTIKAMKINSGLGASSAAWKEALSFDASNEVFGETAFYIHLKDLENKEDTFTARLKMEKSYEGLPTDVKLKCW